MKFYKECQKLRNYYSLTNPNCNLELIILAKLVGISFSFGNPKNKEDALPILKEITINCSDFQTTYDYAAIENSLSKVLSDLNFYNFSIVPFEPFAIHHLIKLTLY